MFLTDEFPVFVLDNRRNTACSYVSDVLIELVSGTDYEITHWTRYQCVFLAFLIQAEPPRQGSALRNLFLQRVVEYELF